MADSIRSFVRGVILRHQVWQALGLLLVHALAVALVLLVVDACLTGWVLEPALWVGGGWLCYVFLRELLGLLLGRRRLQVADLDSGLGMQDMLTTAWLDRGQGSFSAWLRRAVAVRLAQVPPARRRRLWWGACRRALLLLPVVAFLVWLGPLFRLLPIGLTPTGHTASSSQAGGKPSPGASQRESSSKPQSQPEAQARGEDHADTREQEQPPERGPRPGGDSPPPPEQQRPPKPLIAALPVQKEFVVPTWIHEGPGTKTRAPVVETPLPGRRPPGRPPGRRRTEASQDPKKPSPQEQAQEFQRAAERALHARHVPQAERPFVRRYFRELVDGGHGR